jgi:pyochelin synthetase
MHKGWEQIVAVLAIHIAGAAYLPIDPRLPLARRKHLVSEGNVHIVMIQDEVHHGSLLLGVEKVIVSPVSSAPAELYMPPSQQTADSVAYVMYTSGSTGTPKGVVMTHRGAANTILDVNRRMNVQATDAVLSVSSLSFDLSVYDIFGLLAAGGRIVCPPATVLPDPANWLTIANSNEITIWNSVPALMSILFEYAVDLPHREIPSLRTVLLSGDWIPISMPGQVRQIAPRSQVVSLGGATEAGIWSIFYPIERVDEAWRSIPYGRPLSNQSFYIFDDEGRPCPVWVEGELYIGGASLALGYWRDPARTAIQFVPHVLTGERIYKTGDRGRYLPSGDIEFLGRDDLEVKVQGYRISLAEVEGALLQQEFVKQAIAIVAGSTGDRKIIAFLVVSQPLRIQDIRKNLSAILPSYMIPSSIVVVDEMPLTDNGKIDRKALKPPESAVDPDADKSRVATHALSVDTPVAQTVCVLVNGLLRQAVVDPDGDLFGYGMTSIEIVRLANLIDRHFGFRPKIDDLVKEPTINGVVKLCVNHPLLIPVDGSVMSAAEGLMSSTGAQPMIPRQPRRASGGNIN